MSIAMCWISGETLGVSWKAHWRYVCVSICMYVCIYVPSFLQELKEEGVDGYVLNLRGNLGGVLEG